MEKVYNNDDEEETFIPSAENPNGHRYKLEREEKEIPYGAEHLANLPESELEKLTFGIFHD